MRRVAIALAALSLAACPKQPQSERGTPLGPDPGGPDRSPIRDLEHDLEATVLENYTQLTQGNVAAYVDGLSRDRDVVMIGPGAADVLQGRFEDLRDELMCDWRPFAAANPTILSKNLRITTSKKKSVGWISDEMSYRVVHEGREATFPVRFTALFVRDIDRWVLVMQHMSFAVPKEVIERRALRRPRQSLPGLGRAGIKAGVERNVLRIVQNLLASDEIDRERRGASYRTTKLGSAENDLLLWPTLDGEYRGFQVQKAPPLAAVFGSGGRVEIKDYQIGVASGDEAAWIVANLIHTTKLGDKQVQIPLRATYVLAIREFGWTVVQAHVSAPTTPAEVSRRVLGVSSPNPGTGTVAGPAGLSPCKRYQRRRRRTRR